MRYRRGGHARRLLAGLFALVSLVGLPGAGLWGYIAVTSGAFAALIVGGVMVLWGLSLLPFYIRRAWRDDALLLSEPRRWLETIALNALMGTVGQWAFIRGLNLLSMTEEHLLGFGGILWFALLCVLSLAAWHLSKQMTLANR